jgi:hypothetical protein
MKDKVLINEATAQLILDVLTWDHQTWMCGYNFVGEVSPEVIASAKHDFVQFCQFYGIDGVKKEAKLE